MGDARPVLLAHRGVMHLMAGGETYRWELAKHGRERQVAVPPVFLTNDSRVAEPALRAFIDALRGG